LSPNSIFSILVRDESMILNKWHFRLLLGVTLFSVSCAGVKDRLATRRPLIKRPEAATRESTDNRQVMPVSFTDPSDEAGRSASDRKLADDELHTVAATAPDTALTAAVEVPPIPAGADDRKQESESDTNQQEATSSVTVPIHLDPAPVEETDNSFPINLATALRLADARPLVIAAAQASAWVAEARLQRAQVLWIPQFNIGAVYYRHDGYGPDFNRGVNNPAYGGPTPGGPLSQNLNWFYANGSLYESVNLTDAIFQPLAARQTLDAQRFDIQTAKNDALLATAKAYFEVHQYRGQYAGSLDVFDRGQKLVKRIEQLSEDLVPKVEVDRANRMLAGVLQRTVAARERWRISSADLTQVLRLDPTAVIVPMEQDHLQVTLIDPARSLDELVAIGVAHRPEIASNKSQIRAAEVRVRQEKNRPLLPLVLVTGFQGPGGMYSQFGAFGTGSGGSLNQWSFRDDVSLQLIWQLEGLGFGNLARIKQQRGEQSDAIVQLFKNQDKVAAEVTSAQARVQSAALRSIQAERQLREAIVNYDGNYEGLAQTTRFENVLYQVYRPQEAVKALETLLESYDRYFSSVAEYNKAQFELYHAIGYPAREVTSSDSMGEYMDVNVSRPFDLPVVFDGPPAATH
jgi:outer membrane protein TolC